MTRRSPLPWWQVIALAAAWAVTVAAVARGCA
jgi:hypothetical protein